MVSQAFADPIPDGFKQEDEYKSDTQNTVVRVYRGKPDDWTGPMQFRVFRKENPPADGSLLWEGLNRASALISSDGESIAINHHAMSTDGLLYVFTRQANGSYKKIDIDFRDEALRVFTKQQGLKSEPGFDHLYCHAETWLTENQFLGVLSGHMSGEHALDGFWFIFDCRTKKFSFDFTSINKASFHKTHPE